MIVIKERKKIPEGRELAEKSWKMLTDIWITWKEKMI